MANDSVSIDGQTSRAARALSLSYYAGLRVGEIASLKATDVFDDAGNVRDAIRLNAENTKGNEARAVFVSARLKKEIGLYLAETDCAADCDGMRRYVDLAIEGSELQLRANRRNPPPDRCGSRDVNQPMTPIRIKGALLNFA